jgi:hypothetical protein
MKGRQSRRQPAIAAGNLVSGGGPTNLRLPVVLRNLRLLPRANLRLLLQAHSGKGLPHIGCGAMGVLKRRIQNRFQGRILFLCAP